MSLVWLGNLVNVVSRYLFPRGIEVELCRFQGVLLHYLHCLNFDLCMSLFKNVVNAEKILKKEVNVEISKKELYLGGGWGTLRQRNQEVGRIGECLINKNQSCFVCPLWFFFFFLHSFSLA